jgi:hypothetical protein
MAPVAARGLVYVHAASVLAGAIVVLRSGFIRDRRWERGVHGEIAARFSIRVSLSKTTHAVGGEHVLCEFAADEFFKSNRNPGFIVRREPVEKQHQVPILVVGHGYLEQIRIEFDSMFSAGCIERRAILHVLQMNVTPMQDVPVKS